MYVEEKKLGEINDEVGQILLDAADYIERKGMVSEGEQQKPWRGMCVGCHR